MNDEMKKLDGFIAGYYKYKTKYSLMVKFAEKRLRPEIEELKAQRRIMITLLYPKDSNILKVFMKSCVAL